MKGFQIAHISNDSDKLVVHFIYLMTKIKKQKIKLQKWKYILAYIVFNLFDWGISLQLLRRFKVYNKKGTQTDGQAG